jgi:hypothetical protein
MKLAVFTTGRHSPKCSGCPACSESMARLLLPSPARALAAHFATRPLADFRPRHATGTAPAPPSLAAAIRKVTR